MKIRLLNDGLMIEPETDFEVDYINSFSRDNIKSFVKTGIDLSDVLGIKVEKVSQKGEI